MKKTKQILFILMIITLFSTLTLAKDDEKIKLPEPKGGIQGKDLTIDNWSPPSSLSTHFGQGTWTDNSPIFNFNLNLGWMRYYMKNDVDDWADFNPSFSYIIELKPFDFVSFIAAGSSFAIFIEKNEWLRNITFSFTNKTFSSTQLMTADTLWYFDFLYNGIPVPNVIIPQSFTSPSAMERLYPGTRAENVGISNKVHVYQTEKMAVGVVAYFEMDIPAGNEQVVKDASSVAAKYAYSSDLTFSVLGGVFFRMKMNSLEIKSKLLYQRIEGNFDEMVITVKQNSAKANVTASLFDRYFAHIQYYLINWNSEVWNEEFNSHTINAGVEVKGFGEKFEWLGLGVDYFYQTMKQDFGANNNGELASSIFVFSFNWYPLAFHDKNHTLKASILYGLFNYDWDKNVEYWTGVLNEKDSGWNYSLMGKITYAF